MTKPTGTTTPRKPARPPVAKVSAGPVVPVLQPEPEIPAMLAAHPAPAPAPVASVPEIVSAPAPVAPPAAVPAEPAAKDETMDTTTINQTTEQMTDKAQAMLGDATARLQGGVEKGKKALEDMTVFSKDNVEAIVESSKIAARGLETMGQDAAAFAKTSFEGATEAMKTLATVKSPTEFMKLQSDYARTAFDAMVAHTSKSTEAMLKLAGEVAQPISNRFAVAAEKMKIAA